MTAWAGLRGWVLGVIEARGFWVRESRRIFRFLGLGFLLQAPMAGMGVAGNRRRTRGRRGGGTSLIRAIRARKHRECPYPYPCPSSEQFSGRGLDPQMGVVLHCAVELAERERGRLYFWRER